MTTQSQTKEVTLSHPKGLGLCMQNHFSWMTINSMTILQVHHSQSWLNKVQDQLSCFMQIYNYNYNWYHNIFFPFAHKSVIHIKHVEE